MPDAITLLEDDHETVEELFTRCEEQTEAKGSVS